MIAHVLTFAAHRRTLVVLALDQHGIDELGWGDPMRWVAGPRLSRDAPGTTNGRVEIAFLLVALAVAVLAGHGARRARRLPGAARADRRRASRRRTCRSCPRSTSTAEVVLLGLLPPLLYSAAIQTSLVDFNANRRADPAAVGRAWSCSRPSGSAWLVHALLPGIDWPAAFAIGAVVAPPDAVAATAIGRRIGLPRRIVTILEGESLLNDATALVALRTAIAAGAGGVALVAGRRSTSCVAVGRRRRWSASWSFLVVGEGAQARHRPGARHRASRSSSRSRPTSSAEEIHASGVVAVVVAGLLLGHKAPILQTAPVADRRADELAHHRLPPREHRLPADRPAGRAGSSRDVGDSDVSARPDRRGLRRDAGRA